MGSIERAQAGLIVIVRELASGKQRTFHFVGQVKPALTRLCETLDGWPGDWRVQCISSPVSIYTDLVGSREGRQDHPGVQFPECGQLALVGRRDRLAPELQRTDARELAASREADAARRARAAQTKSRPRNLTGQADGSR